AYLLAGIRVPEDEVPAVTAGRHVFAVRREGGAKDLARGTFQAMAFLAGGHVPDTHLPRPLLFLVPRDRGQESAVRRKSNMHYRVSLTLEFAHTFATGRIMNMNRIRYVAYGDSFAVGSEGNVPCKLTLHRDTQSLSPGGPIVDPHGVVLEIGKSL